MAIDNEKENLSDQSAIAVDLQASPNNALEVCSALGKLPKGTGTTALRIHISGSLEAGMKPYSPRFQARGLRNSAKNTTLRQQLMKSLLAVLSNNPHLKSLSLEIDPAVLVLSAEEVIALNAVISKMTLTNLNFNVAVSASANPPGFGLNPNWIESISLTSPLSGDENSSFLSSAAFLGSIPLTSCPQTLAVTTAKTELNRWHPDFIHLMQLIERPSLLRLHLQGLIFDTAALSILLANLPETLSEFNLFSPGQTLTLESAGHLVDFLKALADPLSVLNLEHLEFVDPATADYDPRVFGEIATALVAMRALDSLIIPVSVINNAQSHSALLKLLEENCPANLTLTGGKMGEKEFRRFCHDLEASAYSLQSLTINCDLSEQQWRQLETMIEKKNPPCELQDGRNQPEPQSSPPMSTL